jgi:hypothetical protein
VVQGTRYNIFFKSLYRVGQRSFIIIFKNMNGRCRNLYLLSKSLTSFLLFKPKAQCQITKAQHCPISWTTSSHPLSLTPILILSFHLHLGLPSGFFPWGIKNKIFPLRSACHFYLSPLWLNHYNITWRVYIMKRLIIYGLMVSILLLLPLYSTQVFSIALVLKHLQYTLFILEWKNKYHTHIKQQVILYVFL